MSKPFRCDRPRTVPYEILSLDVWGNRRDGFEVNDIFRTGREVLLPERPTNDEVIACLRADGEIDAKGIRRKYVEVDGDSDDRLFLAYRGHPEMHLQRKSAR